MPYRVVYERAVKEEVKEAKTWYKKQKPGLEKHFATAVRNAIYRMATNPYTYTIRYKNIRIIHTHTFPFGIHFYIDETNSEIVIVAIMHDYRDVIMSEE